MPLNLGLGEGVMNLELWWFEIYFSGSLHKKEYMPSLGRGAYSASNMRLSTA